MKMTCRCGGLFQEGKHFTDSFLVNCMQCNKCGEVLFTPEQTKELIKLREANKVIEGKRKIIKVGSSIAALLPKKVQEYGIKEGIVESVRVLSKNSLEIRFSKDIV